MAAKLNRTARLRAVLVWVLHQLLDLGALQKTLPRARDAATRLLRPRLGRRARPPPPARRSGTPTAPPAPSTPAATPPSALYAAAGSALYGGLLFLAGAWPSLLPAAFLVFASTALPWRLFHYTRIIPRNRMYLLDFCYATAAATAAFLLAPKRWQHPGVEAAVYALADGPVSGALVAWQCAYVFHSPEHIVSVLLHLLPGLAMAAHHHLPDQAVAGPFGNLSAMPPRLSGMRDSALYLVAAPLTFYALWQALYFLAVQVVGQRYIRANDLDTSYRCLTRRARRAGNVWARLVLKGSTARRLVLYGLLQLAFTVGTLLLFIPTYYSSGLAFMWQAIKFMVPVYYGCKYQCERLFKAAMAEGVRRHLLEVEAEAQGRHGCVAPHKHGQKPARQVVMRAKASAM